MPMVLIHERSARSGVFHDCGDDRHEISLLIITWLAAMLICGAIAWIQAQIERMMKRFAERGLTGFGEKKGWRLALHFVGYGFVIIVIIAMFLMLVGVMISLKELLGTAIWDL
ncbi:hypothetical protein HOY80DRAFT_1049068 [Tuber brumale]|nr:hypothetical protein HOY80DRAFT_1049068 [Tuber brumale]